MGSRRKVPKDYVDYENIYTWTETKGKRPEFKMLHDVEFPVKYFTENDVLPKDFPEEWITDGMYKPALVKQYRNDGSYKISNGRWAMAKKQQDSDPNIPRITKAGNLTWGALRVNLIATDENGNQIISIRKGAGEPIYMRFSLTQTEVRKGGKKAKWV